MKKLSVLIVLLASVLSVAEANPPSIYFNSVLNSFSVVANNGYIQMGKWWIRNLPVDIAPEGKIVMSKDGAAKYVFKWTGGSVSEGDVEMVIAQPNDAVTGEFVPMPRITEAGSYAMDVYASDQKVFTFPFTAEKIGEYIFIDGAWSDWAYLIYPDADPLRNLTWRVWLRHKSDTESQKAARISVDIADASGAVLFSNLKTINYTILRDWSRFELDMHNPPGHKSGEDYTKAKYLLEKDGPYTVTMKINGQPYGVWKFAVKGGQIVLAGRAQRAGTDPLTYVEGGGTAWWLEKQK